MKSCSQNPSRGFNGERLRTVTPLNQKPKRLRRMSLALYPSDAATAAPSDSPALRPAQPAPTLVEGQGCCQDEEEANISKLGLRPHHPRQGEPEDLLPDAEMISQRVSGLSPAALATPASGNKSRPNRERRRIAAAYRNTKNRFRTL